MKQIEYPQALSKAKNYCSRYEKCSSDVYNKLMQWGMRNNDCKKILQELIKLKYINDERFTELFIKNKINIGWGKRKIISALITKRISKEIINKNLTNIDISQDLERLNELLISKSKTIKSKNEFDLNVKLFRYAISKGFELEEINKILKIDI